MFPSKKQSAEEQKDDLDRMLELDRIGLPYMPPNAMSSGGAIGPRSSNPVVYLEIAALGGRKLRTGEITKQTLLGRLYIELRRDLLPVAATNFYELCTGNRGYGEDGVRYHYKGTRIHRVWSNIVFQGGDLLDTEGDNSRSIYGGKLFRDENLIFRHTGPGVLSYCNRGPDTNGSLFQMTFARISDFDNKYVVFGCLSSDESFECLRRINRYGSPSGKPLEEIRIVDCGVAFEGAGMH
jgi:cyclophilin family peptidyl-prolyl cis-trans isomerase